MHIEVTSPFPIEALPRVWNWMQTFRGRVSDDFGPQTLDAFVEAMLSTWASLKTWAVYGDGEMGGFVSFQKLTPWVGTAHFLLKPDLQRKGISIQAARLAAADIFANEGVGKLAFYPLEGNKAIGSMLIHLGAQREGFLRGQTLCGGKPTAMTIYGLLKEEFYAVCSSSADHCLSDRGRTGDCGGSDQRGIEDIHQLDDSHAQPGDESTPGPPLSVQQ